MPMADCFDAPDDTHFEMIRRIVLYLARSAE